MKNSTMCAAAIISLSLSACVQYSTPLEKPTIDINETVSNTFVYPISRKGDQVDEYFGEKISDPYRWLEDDLSEETADWVKRQNKVTSDYLEKIPYRKELKESLTSLWNYEKVSAPFVEGEYTYFHKNNGLQDQDVVYRFRIGVEKEPEIFLDPNSFSEDGTTSLAQLTFSEDGNIAAYSISEGGSDWRKIIVIDADTRESIEEPLIDVKFSGISWKSSGGFFYSSYDKPKGSKLSAKTDQHKLYYHKLGEAQSKDELVYGGTANEKHRYISGDVTEDDKYLHITGANSTSGNDLYIKDLTVANAPLVEVLGNFDTDTYVLDNKGSKLLLVTNLDAPNKKIVWVDASNPAPENWVDLVPETENVLSVSVGGGFIFAEYMIDALSSIVQFDYAGKKIREIELPGPGSVSSFGGKKNDTLLYFSFTNYITASSIFSSDVSEGVSSLYRKSGTRFDADNYVSKQVFYHSKDGTRIPMIISHRKDLKLDGSNPTILYGYGGFNVSLTPGFSIGMAVWMEQGGIYAVPNVRGGGEYGRSWHDAGILLKKQNVFNDFIAAAEYLIDNRYTRKERLAIRGGSNGGLLVGAVMNQRPDLVQVALPAVGVMDMLRYHTFTAGAGWAYDYGTSEQSKEMFEYLKAYSPVHNVTKGRSYPATLVTTADHDDRVVPAHSFKFAATLQALQSGPNPTFIRIENSAGHGAGTPVSKSIDQYADIFSFTLFNMGFNEVKVRL